MTKTELAVLEALEARDGRASVGDLMQATKLSESTVKRGLRALIGAMLVERVSGGRHRGDVSQYRGASIPEEGGQGRGSEGGQKGVTVLEGDVSLGRGSNGSAAVVEVSQGRGSEGGQKKGVQNGDPRAHGVILDLEVQLQTPLPPRGPLPLLPDGLSAFDELLQPQLPITSVGTSQTVLADLIDDARANGVVMTRRVIGMFAKAIKDEFDGGATVDQVKAGLALMFARGKVVPSVLSTFVMEASMPKPKPVANPTAMRYGRGMTPAMIVDANPGARELFDAALRGEVAS